jgi:hypothetical protein
MGQAIPRQHPGVVLRSQFNQLRALLAVAMIAVVGLTVAVVILATDSDNVSGTSIARPIESINYGNSAVNPSTGFPTTTDLPEAGVRPDGGPEEGTSGALSTPQANVAPSTRPDGGPEEGVAGVSQSRPQPYALQGLSDRAASAQAEGSQSQSAVKDYSMNGATGDVAPEPEAKFGSRADGGPDEGMHLVRPGSGN